MKLCNHGVFSHHMPNNLEILFMSVHVVSKILTKTLGYIINTMIGPSYVKNNDTWIDCLGF